METFVSGSSITKLYTFEGILLKCFMHILIAPDSFKDSLPAASVADALARGILAHEPGVQLQIMPLADGGEGTVEAMIRATGGILVEAKVHDPLMRPVMATYGISGDGQQAVIEMAAASGLERLKGEERDPLCTTTFGTGELILHALDRGCSQILLGIGGSATNDGGTGMARALGIRFPDERGEELPQGGGALGRMREIHTEGLDQRLAETRIRVACDVDNPLTGPRGASFVYGPQKGASPEVATLLDRNLGHLAQLIHHQLGIDIREMPGAGAAGGLGAGLVAFTGATLEPGFQLVAEACGLEEAIAHSDLVITGEGRLDRQSLHGKTPFGVARLCHKHGKKVIAVAGSVDPSARDELLQLFADTYELRKSEMSLSYAISHAEALLEEAGRKISQSVPR
jgi:glycerate kinase